MTTKRKRNTKTWWKKVYIIIVIIALIGTVSVFPNKIVKADNSFRINYHLILEKDDYPSIEVKITDAPSHTSEFVFGLVQGGALGVVKDLKIVFKDINVSTMDGKSVSWNWKGDNKIIVNNSSCTDFVIKYSVDALKIGRYPDFSGIGGSKTRFVLFKAKRIFFIAGDIFLLPKIDPSVITVSFSLPEGVRMFSSLPQKTDQFVAATDLWGNILYDFQKAYFTGGKPIFSLTHYTEWGDKYIYIWFDRDPGFEAWLPSYGNTPWEQAEKYMEIDETYAKYFRENIGSLPQHTVLFTSGIHIPGYPPVKTNTDWFHYMQIWPRYSEPEICHHVFLQYNFFISQSKLSFSYSPIGSLLFLAPYFEQVVPSILSGQDRYKGKLFEFFVLDARGQKFGIRSNKFHITYDMGPMRLFLLDQYIQKVTDGKKCLSTFVKEMWNQVKDNKKPQEISDGQVINTFGNVVGKSNEDYISEVANLDKFESKDFVSLLPPFKSYMEWMSNKYFWGNKLLFLVFLDITAAKGEEWPHYATYPHNIIRYRKVALTPFKEYLESLNKSSFTEDDIIKAMNNATGKDHSGFFEFWNSFGIKLDSNSLLLLDKWKLQKYDESVYMCSSWGSIGTLKTENYLANIPQKAEAILDKPDNDGKIVIEVRLQSLDSFPPIEEAKNALKGENVSFMNSSQDKDNNLFLTRAFFEVTTKDPQYKEFDFNLILPSFSSHPKFEIYNYPLQGGSNLGALYWLHPIDPINFDASVKDNILTLPDTVLNNEKFVVEFNGKKVNASANDTIEILSDVKTIKISLLDKFGFLRGYKEVIIDTTPPNIEINFPTDNSTIDTDTVIVLGTAIDSESGIKELTVNGNEVELSSDNSFTTTVNLTEGKNTITIIATDKAGNKTTKTITVTYTPPVQTITIVLQPDNPYMTVNGVSQEIDPGRGTKPVIIPKWGRTVVPIRAIVEALGGTISWNGTERKVTINFNNTTIELWIDNPKAEVNGITKWIDPNNHDVKPIIVNDRTMLPLRFVAESLGCSVKWDSDTRTITITYGG